MKIHSENIDMEYFESTLHVGTKKKVLPHYVQLSERYYLSGSGDIFDSKHSRWVPYLFVDVECDAGKHFDLDCFACRVVVDGVRVRKTRREWLQFYKDSRKGALCHK